MVIDLVAIVLNFLHYVLANLAESDSGPFIESMSTIKFILVLVLVGYNIVFILQHYVIYAHPDKDHDLTVHSSDDSLIKSAKRLADDKSRGVHLVGANRK